MKKKILLLITLIVSFAFMMNVKAIAFSCSQNAVEQGKDLTCNISLDEEEQMMVSSDLKIKNVTGAKNTYDEKTAYFNTTGTVVFSTDGLSGDYRIKAEGGDDFSKKTTVTVKEKTTTSKTTTTTKAKSDNNYLSSIKVNGDEIEGFSKTTTKYFVEVENKVKKANIKVETEDENATYEIDGDNALEIGDNEFTISVKSESGTTKFYKVIITRKDEEESSNTDIKKIKIKGYRLNFDKTSKTFHLKIDEEDTELDITVTLKDKEASYEIEGNEDLKDGSVIKINVTAEDGTEDTYRIIIEKKKKNIFPIIITGIFLLVIITVIVMIVINKKKKDKKISDKKVLDEVIDEKTKEAPAISEDDSKTKEIPSVDNDEEEKTRMISYDELDELESEYDYDEDLERTMVFSSDDLDDE